MKSSSKLSEMLGPPSPSRGITFSNTLKASGKSVPRSISLIVPLTVLLLVLLTIAGSGLWVYNASVTNFASQQDIRIAQATRDRVVRLHLASKSDVQAYAATGDTVFVKRYNRNTSSLKIVIPSLRVQISRVDPHYDATPIDQEVAIFAAWKQRVALPILQHQNVSVRQLLTMDDLRYSHMFLSEDAKIQKILNEAILLVEARHRRLLQRLIIARVVFVVGALVVIGSLLWGRERAERRLFMEAALFSEQRRMIELLQESLAPDQLPQAERVVLQAAYYPASLKHAVGGDWYQVIELSRNRLMLVMGDVGGHGLDAAIVMNRARQSITTAAIIEEDPAQVLIRANAVLTGQYGHMVTVLCCVLDTMTREFTYATAGHPSPVIAAPNAVPRWLCSGGPPLGIFPTIELESITHVLEKKSCVYLFTDGLIENDRDVIRGMAQVLEGASYAASTPEPASSLYRHTIVSGEPRDDVAILAVMIS